MLMKIVLSLIFIVFLQTQLIVTTPNDRSVSFELNGRIINGTRAELNATKHQVSIRRRINDGYFFGTGHLCGGSLISSNIVLSAAHCFVNYDINNGTYRSATDYIVVMGNLDRYQRNEYTLIFDIKQIIYNVSIFNLDTYENDIALVFLNDSVPVNYTRAAAIKMNSQQVADNTVCQVTGWGKTEEGYVSDVLLTVDVPIINEYVCANEMNYHPSLIKEGMLCAGYLQGERDACSGDSGGPLVCNNILAGIVSWGISCAVAGQPGVYTNVSYWAPWIEHHTGIQIAEEGGNNGTESGGNNGGETGGNNGTETGGNNGTESGGNNGTENGGNNGTESGGNNGTESGGNNGTENGGNNGTENGGNNGTETGGNNGTESGGNNGTENGGNNGTETGGNGGSDFPHISTLVTIITVACALIMNA